MKNQPSCGSGIGTVFDAHVSELCTGDFDFTSPASGYVADVLWRGVDGKSAPVPNADAFAPRSAA